MTTNKTTEKILKEFDERFPFVKTELGEDRPPHKISEIKDFLKHSIEQAVRAERESIIGKIREVADKYSKNQEPHNTIYNELRALEESLNK